jgi:hypothetical protein
MAGRHSTRRGTHAQIPLSSGSLARREQAPDTSADPPLAAITHPRKGPMTWTRAAVGQG